MNVGFSEFVEEGHAMQSGEQEITNLSADTIKRRHPQFVVKLSARRAGMKLKHALAIASGTAA
jgi:hypothetical protein